MLLTIQSLQAESWKLIWSDEFDGEGLADPQKWDYEEGLVRNKELQYYTRARKENARLENGMLVIEGKKEVFKNEKYDAESKAWNKNSPTADYTSASLITKKKFSFKFGRIEVKAKLPKGKGVWPAIWTLGENISNIGWPKCGEIDIMEFVGKEPDSVHGTVHFSKLNKHSASGKKLQVEKPFSDFHIYAIEWFEDRIDFYFDDQKYHSFACEKAAENGENPFHKPHYLLLNLALGGAWGGAMDDSVLPQKFLIDYVRVYEAQEEE